MLIILFGIIAILSILSPAFADVKNFINIFKQAAINGILATGMMCVILTGGFDLSVGAIVGFSGVIAALFAQGNYPIVIPVLLSITSGLAIGLVNGACIAHLAIPAFVVTLGTQSIVRGLAFLASGGIPIFGVSRAYEGIAGGLVFKNKTIVIATFAVLALIFGVILARTVFGLQVKSVGDNPVAARYAGLPVTKTLIYTYAISGFLVGIAGILHCAQNHQGNPNDGVSYELDAIAAVVIGGTNMSGGKGTITGTIIGAFILGILTNIFRLKGVDINVEMMCKSVIIVVAVWLQMPRKAKSALKKQTANRN